MRQRLETGGYLGVPTSTRSHVLRRFGRRPDSASAFGAAFVALLLVLGISRPCGAWLVTLDGGVDQNGNPYSDSAYEVVLHPDGHLYAVGALAGAMTILKRDASTGAEVWTTSLPGLSRAGRGVVVAPDGGLIVSGSPASSLGWFVAKVDPALGSILWNRDLVDDVSCPSGVAEIAVDAKSGDVFAAGIYSGLDQLPLVVKLDGASGALLWQTGLSDELGDPREVAVDSAGDPVIIVEYSGTSGVHKLDGMTGAPLWTTTLDDGIQDLQLDSADDVVVGGGFQDADPETDVVVKLAGNTGAELWRYQFGLLDSGAVELLAMTSTDDPIAVGLARTSATSNELVWQVARIDGDSGNEEWVHTVSYSDFPGAGLGDVIVDEDDNVYFAEAFGPISIRKLSSVGGFLMWHKTISGTDPSFSSTIESLVYGDGFLYGGGRLNNLATRFDLALFRLDSTDGSGTQAIPGFAFEFNPIWDNPILWVFGVDSQLELIRAIRDAQQTDPLMADAVVTADPRALVREPDRLVVLVSSGPAQEVLTVATVIVFRDRIFDGRSAPCVLFFESGGIGERLVRTAVRLGLWGPER